MKFPVRALLGLPCAALLLGAQPRPWANISHPPTAADGGGTPPPQPDGGQPTVEVKVVGPKEIEALRGGEGLHLVHVWASWCGPCRVALPPFTAIARGLHARGVRVTLVAFDEEKARTGPVAKLLTEAHADDAGFELLLYPSTLPPQGLGEPLDPVWDGRLPSTFLFRNGTRLATARGAPQEAQLLRMAERLLDASE